MNTKTNYALLSDIPATIFRSYDIRGLVKEEITEDTIYTLARAFGGMAREHNTTNCIVARDGRLSSESFGKALIQGLLDSGIDVIDVGLVPTPLMYFALKQWDISTGIMLTASHNPENYNGMKIVMDHNSLSETQIQHLRERVLTKAFCHGAGKSAQKSILNTYLDYITQTVKLSKPFKIVMDCGNAVPGLVAPKLFRALGCEVIEIHCDLDGRFPNHHPDPSVMDNLQDLKQAVMDHKADIGFAFDGDGDRIGVITNAGNIISPDRQLMLLAQDVLQRQQGATIIYDVKCSHLLRETIEKAGGKALMWKTGHSHIKNKMKEMRAALAGEMSGHVFFSERWFGFDDGMYAGVRLLEILSKNVLSSDELFQKLPHCFSTPELKILISEEEKQAFVKSFIEGYNAEGALVSLLDGIRVEYEDGWGLLRVSNTSPAVTLRFEGETQLALETIQQKFKNVISRINKNLSLPF